MPSLMLPSTVARTSRACISAEFSVAGSLLHIAQLKKECKGVSVRRENERCLRVVPGSATRNNQWLTLRNPIAHKDIILCFTQGFHGCSIRVFSKATSTWTSSMQISESECYGEMHVLNDDTLVIFFYQTVLYLTTIVAKDNFSEFISAKTTMLHNSLPRACATVFDSSSSAFYQLLHRDAEIYLRIWKLSSDGFEFTHREIELSKDNECLHGFSDDDGVYFAEGPLCVGQMICYDKRSGELTRKVFNRPYESRLTRAFQIDTDGSWSNALVSFVDSLWKCNYKTGEATFACWLKSAHAWKDAHTHVQKYEDSVLTAITTFSCHYQLEQLYLKVPRLQEIALAMVSRILPPQLRKSATIARCNSGEKLIRRIFESSEE